MLAHEAASLDHLSGGRFELGIGAGWNLEEMRNHGTDPARALSRSCASACWPCARSGPSDEASFHGEFVDFDRIWSWPKPVQSPLPVWVGGTGPRVLDRVLEYGDGWFPNMRDLDELATRIAELQRRAADAGRERIPVTYFGLRDADDEKLEKMAAAGVDRVLLMLPPRGADETLPRLERYAELAARHR